MSEFVPLEDALNWIKVDGPVILGHHEPLGKAFTTDPRQLRFQRYILLRRYTELAAYEMGEPSVYKNYTQAQWKAATEKWDRDLLKMYNIARIPQERWGATMSRGSRAMRRRALNTAARWVLYATEYITNILNSITVYVGTSGMGKIASWISALTARTTGLLLRGAGWVSELLDAFIVIERVWRHITRWWYAEGRKEIQRRITEEYIRNIPAPEPVFEPRGSEEYAKALREYAKYSKSELRDILVNSAVGVAVYAGRRGLIRKSTRETTNLLKVETRKYYNAPTEEGGLRIQRILAAVSEKQNRDLRIPDKKEARKYVARTKVKPLTRSRAVYYQAGWFQMAEALGKHQKHGKRKFKYRGKIPKGLGTADVTPKFSLNHVVTLHHHGAWARQSAQIAIEEALKNEVKGKMAQIKKRQEKGWRQMKTK